MASFTKYTGPWNRQTVAHLFRRTTFGIPSNIQATFVNAGLDGTLDKLFESLPLPSPPIYNKYDADPNAPLGQTWVDKISSIGVDGQRNRSLTSWSLDQMLKKEINIREKLVVFWHNHFVVADVNDARLRYYYITLLRKSALGNFKQLTKDITIDCGMLNYLNGRENTNVAPNENFARELMELFTLGKGDIAGPGDYTTFTETDVKEMAKALTGWSDVRNEGIPQPLFRIGRHDTTTKTLSPRFGNQKITNGAENEYKQVVDIIFERTEVALFIARKLYTWFVNPKVTPEIETDIILPMSNLIRQSNYEIAPALKTLLSSEHFYDECVRGILIKNPIDNVIGVCNLLSVDLSTTNMAVREDQLAFIYGVTTTQQMGLFQAPSVAGWTPFYQLPTLDGLWLNSSTLPARKVFTDTMASNGFNQASFNNQRIKVNHINFLDSLSAPQDVDKVLDDTVNNLFCNPVAPNQRAVLRAVLLGTTTAANWTTMYNAYKADPTNDTKRQPLIARLTALLVYMMRMPEYHLS